MDAPDSTAAPDSSTPLTPQQQALADLGARIVADIARALAARTRRHTADDLVSIGHDALLRATRTFDPQAGAAFGTWVHQQVGFAMLEANRREARQAGIRKAIGVAYCDLAGVLDLTAEEKKHDERR